jgi:polyphosphate kinase
MKDETAKNKERFIHRDISWLDFNYRVLEEACDETNPPLERLKFLSIFCANLDEFYMVRVAGLRRLIDSGYNRQDDFGWFPQELFVEVEERVKNLLVELYACYGDIKKELAANKINFRKHAELSEEQRKYIDRYFDASIFPVITPMAIDQGHPFPVLPSKTTAFAVMLKRGDKNFLAIIPIPKILPRLIKLPVASDSYDFIFIEEAIKENLAAFFKGHEIVSSALFRLIRDSEISIDEEYASDLLRAIESEIKKRPKAKVVRMEIEKSCSGELKEIICDGLWFPVSEVFSIDGNLDLSALMELVSQPLPQKLFYPAFTPKKLVYENIFDKIKEGDFFIHLPFDSFVPTIDLIQQAARCPDVLAIKMTLYRTNEESAIVMALKEAAKNKKQVTVLVELKARFDEEKNIDWAKDLESAGCHVIYGMPKMKIHCKMALVVRREDNRIRRYVHLGTGNYNEKTAKIYTDIGYFTVNEDVARDVSEMFNVITGYSAPSKWRRIVASPEDMRKYFFALIDKEIEFQKKSKNGEITVKINSLEDPQVIEKLYSASSAGVKIRLIVRGICSLIPGVPKMSENIEVTSIVGRFLEHSRIYIFNNNQNPQVFIASADWMTRNLDRRVELLCEVYGDHLKNKILSIMKNYLKDNVKARELTRHKRYLRNPAEKRKFNAQEFFLSDQI